MRQQLRGTGTVWRLLHRQYTARLESERLGINSLPFLLVRPMDDDQISLRLSTSASSGSAAWKPGSQSDNRVAASQVTFSDPSMSRAIQTQLQKDVRAFSRSNFQMPWESDPFGRRYDQVNEGLGNLFYVGRGPMLPPVQPEVLPAQQFLKAAVGGAINYVTRRLSTITWPATKIVERERAYSKWRLILEENHMATQLGAQLQQAMVSMSPEHELTGLIEDTFQDKSTATLVKRSASLADFMVFVRRHYGVAGMPVVEERAYAYVRSLVLAKSSPSKPASFVSALNFAAEVLKAQGCKEAATSIRIKGAAQRHLEKKGMLKQAKLLRVDWVKILEAAVYDAPDAKDRVAAGFFVFLVHGRPRFSDAMFSCGHYVDVDDSGNGYLEAGANLVKTARTVQLRRQMMPLTAPVRGVSQREWAVRWLEERRLQGIDKFEAVLPTVGTDGEWHDFPCDAGTANRWLKAILRSFGVSDSLEGVTSQGCKATSLSWMAKADVDFVVRQLLGHHVPSHLTSVITYSRDSLAGPLRQYDKVLLAIRSGQFAPDNSRSGRYLSPVDQEVPAASTADILSEIHVDSADLGRDLLEPDCQLNEPELVDVSGSDSSSDSSDSQESDKDLQAQAVLCKARPSKVHIPPGVKLYVCNASRLLHVRGKRVSGVNDLDVFKLQCGKVLSLSFREINEERINAYSKCIRCFSNLCLPD